MPSQRRERWQAPLHTPAKKKDILAVAVEAEAERKFKVGVVAVKLRAGSGRATPMLLVVTAATWERMNGSPKPDD